MTIYIVSLHTDCTVAFASTDRAAAEQARVRNGAQRYHVHAVECEGAAHQASPSIVAVDLENRTFTMPLTLSDGGSSAVIHNVADPEPAQKRGKRK